MEELPEQERILYEINILNIKKITNENRIKMLNITINKINDKLDEKWYKRKLDSNTKGYLKNQLKNCKEELEKLITENKKIDKKLNNLNNKSNNIKLDDYYDEEMKRA